ncbi:MAG: DUF1801 domain-containing protein [Gemmataceae bacterium]|nr:DUF1801 domain-containing protein [Gemmataceae bacterium]
MAKQKSSASAARHDPAVDEYLRLLDHQRKAEIEAVREAILAADPAVAEGIKWNAPSFRSADYFATVNLRARGGEERVWVILHSGAKGKKTMQDSVADPAGLVEWLAPGRGLVTFADPADFRRKKSAFQSLIRAWIALL